VTTAIEPQQQAARRHALDPAVVERLSAELIASGEPVTTTAPFTGERLARLPQSSPADVAEAFRSARAAGRVWAATDPGRRAAVFVRLHDLVLRRQAEILDVIQWETGKARMHAFEEVLEVAACALYVGRRTPGLLRPRRRVGAFPILTKAVEARRPKGVVAVITPWNYPLALTEDVIPALAAGNAVVQKPDTQTALTALWLRDLAIEAGLPPDVWQVVLGSRGTVGDPIIDGADFVAFTGSTAAGRAIAERCGRRLIGCSLELGGKNPMVVLADADAAKAADGAIRACFSNAGQLCVSIERLYVHQDLYAPFVEAFLDDVGRMKLSSGFDFGADMGSMTHARQFDAVRAHVDDARSKGATVVAGGDARPDLGPLFFEPTVLTGVGDGMAAYREETFGPVVSVYPVADDDEAVTRANDSEYGLNASVWSRDVRHARAVAARIDAGTININEGYGSAYGSQDAPMGGVKASGLGRRHGTGRILELTEAQTVASQHLVGFDPPFGLGAQTYANVLTQALLFLKKTRIR
jgi:succinate-semialdehyde dehydrogenase/glutarate-semialdehyde dehydrogenase